MSYVKGFSVKICVSHSMWYCTLYITTNNWLSQRYAMNTQWIPFDLRGK